MIDTHAHIYLDHFRSDLDKTIQRSRDADITKIYMPNIDAGSIDQMLELEEKYKNYCVPMMGLHPCSVDMDFRKTLQEMEQWLKRHTFAAIGEIGIDLYWDKTFVDQQVEAFELQIQWAKDMDLPVVIHCRDSMDMVIDLVGKHPGGTVRGVFHCFTGSLDQANRIIDMGFFLGIGGVLTFKNSGLAEVLSGLDIDHIVLETDSPYLAPVPYRGKRNEPSYLEQIAEKLAQVKECSVQEVKDATTNNATKLFNHG